MKTLTTARGSAAFAGCEQYLMKPPLTIRDPEPTQPTTPGDIRRALAARDSAVLRAEAEAQEAAADAWERACRAPRRWPRWACYAVALLGLVAGLAWLIERLPAGLGATLVAAVATWAILVAVLGGGKPR
jgi:hypothetical protein